MKQTFMRIEQNELIAPSIYQMILSPSSNNMNDVIKPVQSDVEVKPGQFIYLRINDGTEPLLRRPISIHDYNPLTKQITLIYRIKGDGTKRISSKKRDEMIDVLGPLGNGFTYESMKHKHVVIIGGGIGIPPLYYLAKKILESGVTITTLLGFQSAEDAILIEQFALLGEVRVATIDGSLGTKGTVLDLINEGDKWDTFYSCGPKGMLRGIQEKWEAEQINGYISLEERMGCGVGACYGCIIKVDPNIEPSGYKKVCSDGPVFSFREVIL